MIDYDSIPDLTMDGLTRYVVQGIPPGGFLTAVICNDLKEAVGRADPQNTLALHSIVAYFYNETPSACWGSPERMQDWMAARRFEAVANREAKND
jgi:hypothetical protein